MPHSVVEKDSLLLEALNCIRKGDFNKARHDVLSERSFQDDPVLVESLRKRVVKIGNIEKWSCWGSILDYRPFPVLFQSHGVRQLIWGACSKLGENCPLHKHFEAKSQHRNQPKRQVLHIGYVKDLTIQQSIFYHIGSDERPCKRRRDLIHLGDSSDKMPIGEAAHDIAEYVYCPAQGMRQTSLVNSFLACPWVMTIYDDSKTYEFHSFQTLHDIPKQVVVPPDIQYSLAVVLLHNGQHYRAISVDAKNLQGNHVIYDGMDSPSKRIQIFNSNDLTSQYAEGYSILELWYVKVESSSDAPGSAPSVIPPAVQPRVPLPSALSGSTIIPTPFAVSSTAVKPPGIPNLGNTCYLTTLVQIIFWVAPLTNGLIEVKLTKNDSTKFDQDIFFAGDSKTPTRLFEGLKRLKLLSSMKKSIEDKKRQICHRQGRL